MSRHHGPRLVGLAMVAIVILMAAAPAAADQAHHTTRSTFHAVGDAPLRSGFIANIHANGPNVFAHEVYTLNGAMPNTTFQVVAHVYFDDLSCGGDPNVSLPVGDLTTNRAGNATGDIVLSLEAANALGFRNGTGADRWEILLDGEVIYQSDCVLAIAD
jgi:hypothetical protein